MFYQISNTATRSLIEAELRVRFKYSQLYTPRNLIDGLEESTIEIITSEQPAEVSLAIWGILPHKFDRDWEEFQQISNTLTIPGKAWRSDHWLTTNIEHKRCVIICTGFYSYRIHKGQLQRSLVHHAGHKPFVLGGIYNQLDDGFLTCSLLTKPADDSLQILEPTLNRMPLIIDPSNLKTWLNPQSSTKMIDHLTFEENRIPLQLKSATKTLNIQ